MLVAALRWSALTMSGGLSVFRRLRVGLYVVRAVHPAVEVLLARPAGHRNALLIAFQQFEAEETRISVYLSCTILETLDHLLGLFGRIDWDTYHHYKHD